MKELSIEEKAKAYDKVRDKIAIRFGSNVAKEIFSEYEESEDERIRKELIRMVKEDWPGRDDVLAWLEKQGENNMGISETTKKELEDNLNKALEKETPESWNKFLDEQNPTWGEKDEIAFGDALWCCKQAASIAKDENEMGNAWYAERWLKALKDRHTWKPSDEQLDALQYVYRSCNPLPSDKLGWDSIRTLELMYQELKKLRDE